jgi:hypothetical protein
MDRPVCFREARLVPNALGTKERSFEELAKPPTQPMVPDAGLDLTDMDCSPPKPGPLLNAKGRWTAAGRPEAVLSPVEITKRDQR